MSSSPVEQVMSTLSKTSIVNPTDTSEALSTINNVELRKLETFLATCNPLEILRHFCGQRIDGAPTLLDEAIFVAPDLEWWDIEAQRRIHAVTEVGVTMIRGRDLADIVAGKEELNDEDLLRILDICTTYHIRVRENCHMRNNFVAGDGVSAKDAEKHSLFAQTRFVPLQ